jgi:hypothetical protein
VGGSSTLLRRDLHESSIPHPGRRLDHPSFVRPVRCGGRWKVGVLQLCGKTCTLRPGAPFEQGFSLPSTGPPRPMSECLSPTCARLLLGNARDPLRSHGSRRPRERTAWKGRIPPSTGSALRSQSALCPSLGAEHTAHTLLIRPSLGSEPCSSLLQVEPSCSSLASSEAATPLAPSCTLEPSLAALPLGSSLAAPPLHGIRPVREAIA